MTAQQARPGELSGPRSLENAQEWMRARLKQRFHPLGLTDPGETLGVIDSLQGLDGDNWAGAWMAAGERRMEAGHAAETAGDRDAARAHYEQAYGLFFLGRFPCPNHPAKLLSYQRELDAYRKYGALLENPVEKVAIPFDREDGEGDKVSFYVRRPPGVARPPVVIMWGGVDAWKEEMTEISERFLKQGVATVAMDNAGTGESPVLARPGAERQFVAVMDWVAAQGDLNGARPALLGRSFGGYWATKLAHLHPERIAAAVNWGGGVHHMFQPSWVEASRWPDSYLMELVETRSRMLGAANDAEYVEGFRRLSLVDAGLLDRPCAPMLLVNGKEDKQCPIDDLYLLLDYGSPKAVRLFPGGHMGFGPHTVPTIVDWVSGQLKSPAAASAG
jgi:esterase FrsA